VLRNTISLTVHVIIGGSFASGRRRDNGTEPKLHGGHDREGTNQEKGEASSVDELTPCTTKTPTFL
jgi:hypothetical protein